MLINLTAADPGGETGVAHALYRPDPKVPAHVAIVEAFRAGRGEAFQLRGDLRQQVLDLQAYMLEQRRKAGHGLQDAYKVRNVFVYEGFVLFSKAMKDSALTPVRFNAMMEFYLWLEPETDGSFELDVQMSAELSLISDDTLRKWGLWQKGKKNDDAMPALKHLIIKARKLQKELQ